MYLPADLSERIFFEGFAVTEVWIPGCFEVVMPDETLDGVHADGCRNEGFLYQTFIDLRCIHAWILFFDPVDFCNCLIIQGAGCALVRPGYRHQCVKTADAVLELPFFQGFIAVFNGCPIRKCKWCCTDPFVVSSSASTLCFIVSFSLLMKKSSL